MNASAAIVLLQRQGVLFIAMLTDSSKVDWQNLAKNLRNGLAGMCIKWPMILSMVMPIVVHIVMRHSQKWVMGYLI